MDSRLYIVEGLPCTGKSTTAQRIADYLSRRKSTRVYDEQDRNHPTDFEFHAYLTLEQMQSFQRREQQELLSVGRRLLSGYIIPLTGVSIPLFGKIIRFRVYDTLDWSTVRQLMCVKWSEFAEEADGGAYVLNSCFLQKPVTEALVRFDMPPSAISGFIGDIYGAIRPLDPVVVYLRCTDVRAHLERVAGPENDWIDGMADYHTKQGYGKRRGLSGFDGLVDCLSRRQEVELGILEELPVEKLVITDAAHNWDDAYTSICAYMDERLPATRS